MPVAGTLANTSGGIQTFYTQLAVDFASIAAVTSGTVTAAIVGALPGDVALAWATTAPTSGVVIEAASTIVGTADQVVVRATNSTAGAVDLGSQILRFLILRFNVPL